jgi:hypothetical protein
VWVGGARIVRDRAHAETEAIVAAAERALAKVSA